MAANFVFVWRWDILGGSVCSERTEWAARAARTGGAANLPILALQLDSRDLAAQPDTNYL